MKNALILHGAGNNSLGNWFPWLKLELEKKGYQVFSPNLPNTDTPVLKDWSEAVFSNKNFEFNSETIMIGHSSGATLILRILEQQPKNIKINKAILVAGFINKGTIKEYFQYKVDLLKTPFNWGKIKSSCSEFYFICSDNDKYQCGQEQSRVMHENLGGKLILKSGQGHFNLEVSEDYRQFPFLLELI